jgi:hypothetical protein
MSCAPCFLAKPEDCPRGLACIEMLDPALVWQMARRFLGRPVNGRIAALERPAPDRSDPVVRGRRPAAVLPTPQMPAEFGISVISRASSPPVGLLAEAANGAGRSARRLTKPENSGAAKPAAAAKRSAKQATGQPAGLTARMAKGSTPGVKQSRGRTQRTPVTGLK